jgi:hypothetical protein
MVSSGMLRRVALVRTDVSEEPGASFIRMRRIGELGTTQAATRNRFLQEPHGVTSQKTPFFIVNAVKTSNIKSVVFSPQANYTDWSTSTCWLNLMPAFVDRRKSRGQSGRCLTVVNISFVDPSRYFFSSSSSFILMRLSGPRFRPTAMQKIL